MTAVPQLAARANGRLTYTDRLRPPIPTFLAVLLAAPCAAQTAATPQRPSFSTDASTTAPGTVEIEIGGATFDGFFALPTTVKFTPAVDTGPFRELEWSVSFDGFVDETGRSPRFSDTVVLAARKALLRRGGFSFAAAPFVASFVRGEDGVRAGATAIGVYQFGRNALVGNLLFSAASDSSATNPARSLDGIVGVSRSYGRASLFAEALVANPSGGSSSVSLMQGVAFALRPNLVFDVALQQSDVDADASLGVIFGLTANLGRWN